MALRAEERAERRAGELQQVADFQAQMLADVNPTESGVWLTNSVMQKLRAAGNSPESKQAEQEVKLQRFRDQWNQVNATDVAREFIDHTILSPAVTAIDREFKDQLLVDARLRQVLADLYRNLGMYDASTPLQKHALETRRRELRGF